MGESKTNEGIVGGFLEQANTKAGMAQVEEKEYITEEEAQSFKELFQRSLQAYKEKKPGVTDQAWLAEFLVKELPQMTEEEAKAEAEKAVGTIQVFATNLKSCNEAATRGISKERWLEDKLREAATGMAANEYNQALGKLDQALYEKNLELADALARSKDQHIMMSPNLDGNIAENMVAKTTELSAVLQGKDISVQVLDSHNLNSVDVRAINHATGQYQNYQLKFGKDAQATIQLLKKGNYNNQRIVVPSEQLKEVQQYFKGQGSNKTITDHIEAWGAKGKSFTKEDMKSLQKQAQSSGKAPQLDYSHFRTEDLVQNIGKNAGVMALQTAAVTTGINVAAKIFKGEHIDGDQLVKTALKTGADTGLKTVTTGVLKVAVEKGVIKFIPKGFPLANIACVGIENAKIIAKIASGELSVTKGLDRMGRVTTSMYWGLQAMGEGAAIGAGMTAWIPVVGPALAVVTGFIGGTIGYLAGSKFGEACYGAFKKVASVAKTAAKAAVRGIKAVGSAVVGGIKKIGRGIKNLLGF